MSKKKKTQIQQKNELILKSKQESSFQAVKNLLEADKNIEIIKNRIKVLQLNEEKNISKINIQKQQIQKINMVRNQHFEQLRKMKINKRERQRIIEQVKARNEQIRKQHHSRVEALKQQIYEEKAKGYDNTIEMREINQSIILENKINLLQKKQQNKNFILQNNEKSKQNILKFFDQKTKSIYEQNQAEIDKLNRIRQNKQKKFDQFSKVQMEMIEKHSQSQLAFKQMKSKLDSMLGKIKQEKRKGVKDMKSSIHREGKQNINNLDGI